MAAPLIALEAELPALKDRIARVQFGGAAGNNLAVAPYGADIAETLASELGLGAAVQWHGDRGAVMAVGAWVGRLTAALGKMAGDLILMGRSEAAEGKAGKGGGSSTMPQKSNPVASEAIVTLNAYATALNPMLAMAASPAEERDGGRWAMEWFALPQILIAGAAALRHGADLAATLQAFPENMARMLDANGGGDHVRGCELCPCRAHAAGRGADAGEGCSETGERAGQNPDRSPVRNRARRDRLGANP